MHIYAQWQRVWNYKKIQKFGSPIRPISVVLAFFISLSLASKNIKEMFITVDLIIILPMLYLLPRGTFLNLLQKAARCMVFSLSPSESPQ